MDYSTEFFKDILERHGEEYTGKGKFAIMVPLVKVEGETHLLFEVRAFNMRRQPGEICFPGGRIEKKEEPPECAVRETCEELRTDASNVELVGSVGHIYSWLNEKINIIMGELPDYKPGGIDPNPDEVHSVFTVPFDYFMKNGIQDNYNYDGNHFIWGLTARTINKLVKMCREGLK